MINKALNESVKRWKNYADKLGYIIADLWNDKHYSMYLSSDEQPCIEYLYNILCTLQKDIIRCTIPMLISSYQSDLLREKLEDAKSKNS